MNPLPRYVGLFVLLAMAGFASVGFFTIRKDVEELRVISQDNILWSATQMEVELLRFQLSLSELAIDPSEETLETVSERFDILWSRVFMMRRGRVGEVMRSYDEGHGSLDRIARYLQEIDPVLQQLKPTDSALITSIASDLRDFQQELRLYTLRVVRGDTAKTAATRNSIQTNAQTTAILSTAAVLISVLSLFLILRENRRQRALVELNLRVAREAEQANRAKSRFLTMMSHELRNPLNGIVGPLALLNQSEIEDVQRRLVDQAQNNGQSMARMLVSMLDYAEMQDGELKLREEPVALHSLARSVEAALGGMGGARVPVEVTGRRGARLVGDPDRLSDVFVNLAAFLLEVRKPSDVQLVLEHEGDTLIGDITIEGADTATDWKIDLLMGLSEVASDQVSSDALRPLIAKGLISSMQGVLALSERPDGARVIEVRIPAEAAVTDTLRVYLETRSAALEAIYRAALKSEQVDFCSPDEAGPVDLVLVDSTSVGDDPRMTRLRNRYPDALFVSLGNPAPDADFDDVVASPSDMSGLRDSILGRLAS